MQSAVGVGLRARHRGCLHVLFVAVALPVSYPGDRSTDCADGRRRDNGGPFLRVALDASNVEILRPHDDLDAPVVNEAPCHTGIEHHPPGACRFVSRRNCRGVSTHRMYHSVESHGGMLRLDCASANAAS